MPRPGAGGSWQEPPIASAEGPGRGDSPGVLGKGEVSVGATESGGTQVMGFTFFSFVLRLCDMV